ncbi:hypothetical protein MBANPS3_005117 [Mucor bainieri]
MHNHLATTSMEDYLLNASFLLGNQSHQDQFPAVYPTSCGSLTTSSNSSSSNSCIDDFDYMNPLLSTDMFTPASTIVYDDGVSCSPSYPMADNEVMNYLFLPTPAPTAISAFYDELSSKMEYDEVNCIAPFQEQQQFQPQDMPLYEDSYLGQPHSPESMYSFDSHHIAIKAEAAATADQAQQKEAQTQAKLPKKLAASTASTTTTTTTATTTTSPRPKIFACTHCNRTFARKYDAARHKRIHTGVKPYHCPCCNKGFARSDARVRHFRTEYNCRDGADKIQESRQRSHNQRCTAPTSSNLSHS